MLNRKYVYDKGGNITELKKYINGKLTKTNTYTYGNSNWKDLLKSYNGNKITYDEIGNPLTYYNGMEFKWTMGRRLKSVKNGNANISYAYNADGLRTRKIISGIQFNYYWNGDKLTGQTCQGSTLYFYYDKDGNPIGFDYNDKHYDYITNLQGDIIAILDMDCNLVAEYEYDSWGNCTITYDTNSIAYTNPLRYRGYYYDSDTNLYYLQSRYYDANIGRFINADDAEIVISGFHNSFCYCINNPVMMIDSSGYVAVNVSKIPDWIFTLTTKVAWGSTTKTLIKSIIYGAAKLFLQSKKYILSRDMFYHAIYKKGKNISNSDKLGKDTIKKLKKSNLSYNISELLKRADSGSKRLQGKYLKSYSNSKLSDNFTSGDLHYAIGKYDYTISASVYKEDFNKKSVRRYWKVKVVFKDKYDFEEVRAFENSILSDASNDLGLFMQKTGLLKPFNIKLSYTDYTSEVQTI